MSTKKITDLTLISSATAGLSLPADDGIQSYRTTIQQISDFILGVANVPLSALNLTIFNGLTAVTAATNDYMVIADTSDSSKTKKALISDIFNNNVRSVTTTDAAALTDRTLIFSGASFTETLPTAVGNAGKVFELIHNDTSLSKVYTIGTTLGQTIGGVAGGSYALCTNGEVLVVISDNANWLIKEHRTATDDISAGAIALSSLNAYTFTITSATVVQGDTYTNNGKTFTITSSGTVTSLPTSGTGAPASSGTLTKASGSGPSTLTFASVTSSVPVIGTNSINAVTWSRQGKYATIRFRVQTSAGGTAGTGNYVFFLPSGLVADTTSQPLYLTPDTYDNINTWSAFIGSGMAWDSGPSTKVFNGILYSTTSFRVITLNEFSAVGFVGSGQSSLSASTICYNFSVRVQISGWQP